MEAIESLQSLAREAGLDKVPVPFLVIANLHARVYFGLAERDVGRPFQELDVSSRPLELRSRLEQAYAERHTVMVREVEWRSADETRFLDVQISPLTTGNGELVGCGVSFTDVSRHRRLQAALQDAKRAAQTAHDELQSTVAELETTNQVLHATNQDLHATNQELHTTNEELHATNVELRATNEELATINDELHQRRLDLNAANRYLEAILTSLRAAVVVLDGELRIQAWNAGARDLWGLTEGEVVGRPFLELEIGLPVQKLRAPIRDVLEAEAAGDQPLLLEATSRTGRAIRCSISLTRLGDDGHISGVILMMQAEEQGLTDPAGEALR
jgi:two-component system, chemotaxis family, CheB/CheR fusion protein